MGVKSENKKGDKKMRGAKKNSLDIVEQVKAPFENATSPPLYESPTEREAQKVYK